VAAKVLSSSAPAVVRCVMYVRAIPRSSRAGSLLPLCSVGASVERFVPPPSFLSPPLPSLPSPQTPLLCLLASQHHHHHTEQSRESSSLFSLYCSLTELRERQQEKSFCSFPPSSLSSRYSLRSVDRRSPLLWRHSLLAATKVRSSLHTRSLFPALTASILNDVHSVVPDLLFPEQTPLVSRSLPSFGSGR